MKNTIYTGVLVLAMMFSCSESESPQSEYTGRTISYELYAASDNGVPGIVEFKERIDKSVDVIITLGDLEGSAMFPSHLHLGDLSNPDAPQAVLLNDYDVEKGVSLTNISRLADETPFSFDSVENFDGSVKVHLGNYGDAYNTIVSAANIGKNESLGFNLQSVSVCSPDLNEK